MDTKNIQLYKITKNDKAELMISQLKEATTFFQRAKGLLGRQSLADNEGLWIRPCNNIHTFFMKFNIDCIFVDKNLVIQRIKSNMSPFRIAGPDWKTVSVIEVKAGTAEKWKLATGDRLYVVS